MAGLSDLCFDPGIKFASLVKDRFGCSVSPTSAFSSGAFHHIMSFGRSALCLNEDSVGLILQACLGGIAKKFNVFHLLGSMFSFSVSCKNVGIMIYKLKSFSYKYFAAFFHLWSRGGPNWQREFDLWTLEQEAKWTTVGSKFKKSFAEVIRSPAPKGPIFLRLKYPKTYHANFGFSSIPKRKLDASSPKFMNVMNSHPDARSSARSMRVQRCVQKSKISKPVISKKVVNVALNEAPSQELLISNHSNSKDSSPPSSPSLSTNLAPGLSSPAACPVTSLA